MTDKSKAASRETTSQATYEVADPTVDSQIIGLKNSGANAFFNITTPKFAAQAIRKAFDSGWKPVQYLSNVSASVGSGSFSVVSLTGSAQKTESTMSTASRGTSMVTPR